MYAINDIPISVGDIVSYNFYAYGINDTLICTITDIVGNCISIRISNTIQQLERYKYFNWFYDEWKHINPDYIFELVTHLAPDVPNINDVPNIFMK